MEIAFDCSFVDYPLVAVNELDIREEMRPCWVENTWGEDGLERVFDSILATGSRRVHFRSHCAGPWWPTKVPEAAPGSVADPLNPSFRDWNPVEDAVRIGHSRGMKVIGWFDMTEGHAGIPTRWALSHPQFCIVNREGSRLDGPLRLVDRDGHPFDPGRHRTYSDFIEAGLMDGECERPDGTTIDPHLSLAFPEVIEYRIQLLRELLSFGVDGIYLTANSCVGYEEPVVRRFEDKHGISPFEVLPGDPRWISHQRGYFNEFIRKVQSLVEVSIDSEEGFEIALEGQGTGSGPMEPEPGWKRVPGWVKTPDFIDFGAIASSGLVDTISLWSFREMDRLEADLRGRVKISTRYRYMDDVFSREDYQKRISGAESRGVSMFVFNEPRVPLGKFEWLYRVKPGPIYDMATAWGRKIFV